MKQLAFFEVDIPEKAEGLDYLREKKKSKKREKMKNLATLTIILIIIQFLVSLAAQTRKEPELIIQKGHTGSIKSVIYSPDGRIIASGSEDGTIKLWTALNGQEIRTLIGHKNKVHSVAFSPNGQILASGSEDNTIKLWDVESGQSITTLSDSDYVYSVAFSPDGKMVVSGGKNGSVKLWDVVGEQLLETFDGHKGIVQSVTFSPQGGIFASGGYDHAIKLWDVNTRKEVKTFKGNTRFINSIVFSPDGKTLASGSGFAFASVLKDYEGGNGDSTVKLWNLKTGEELKTSCDDIVDSVAFSPDGKILASTGLEGNVKLWDARTGRQIKTIVPDTILSINAVVFSPDGKTLALGLTDNIIKLLNVADGQEIKTLTGHILRIYSAALSPDDKILALGSRDIKLFDITNGGELKTFTGHTAAVSSVTFSPDGKTLASGSISAQVKLWDIQSGKEIRSFEGKESIVNVNPVAFSPNGKILASGIENQNIILWDVQSGRELHILKGHTRPVYTVAFSPDGKVIASGGEDKNVKIWDVSSGQLLKTLTGHSLIISKIAFSQNGKIAASSSFDGTIKLWDIDKGEELKSYRLSKSNFSQIFAQVPGLYRDRHIFGLPGLFTLDGRFQIASGNNGRIDFLETKEENLLASFTPFNERDWAVLTFDGRFDTNNLENPQGLHWLVSDMPLTPLSIEVFMRDYFEPKLLPRLLSCTEDESCDQEFKPVRNLLSLNRTQPRVEIKEIRKTTLPDVVKVLVRVENVISEFQKSADKNALGSGVFDLRLFRNGQLVGYSTTAEKLNKTFRTYRDFNDELEVWRETNRVDLINGKKTFSFQVKLPSDTAGKPIEFSAYAFNDDRVKSDTSRKTYTLPKKAVVQPESRRRAYVITFGVNNYDNSEWNLQFAGNDAREMQKIFSEKLRGRKEFSEVVEIPLISDDEMANSKAISKRAATKGNIKTVLELLSGKKTTAGNLKNLEKAIGAPSLAKIKRPSPNDMILLFFSSHGYADKNGVFYILPTDIGKNSAKKLTDDLLRNSISSDELSLWLRDIDAGEMVMIVDACHAASAVEGRDFKPGPMGSRGLGQLAFDKGMKILTATQAANTAIEVSGSIGHGLLTYALLREGLNRDKADFKAKDKTINLKEWLEYGEFEVPKLYEKLIQGELKGIGKGIDIINLSSGDKKQTLLQTPALFDFTKKSQEMILEQLP